MGARGDGRTLGGLRERELDRLVKFDGRVIDMGLTT